MEKLVSSYTVLLVRKSLGRFKYRWKDTIYPLRKNVIRIIYRPSLYHTVNTYHFSYENLSLNAAQGKIQFVIGYIQNKYAIGRM